MSTRTRVNHQRARGNLSYLDFVRLIQRLWGDSNPKVPIVPTGEKDNAVYPCIAYGLELRAPVQGEPKPKFREVVEQGDERIIVSGQRFMNVISFTVYTETDPDLAEEIIESFEDFVLEMTPLFKELGVSEMVYNKRYPDSGRDRSGPGIVTRKVSYSVTTERVTSSFVSKLEEILINIIDADGVAEEEEPLVLDGNVNDGILIDGNDSNDFVADGNES